jgi:hypothetical protein
VLAAEVRASDPFDLAGTQQALLELLRRPSGLRPFDRRDFRAAIEPTMPADRVDANLKAFDLGRGYLIGLIKSAMF